MALQYSNSAQVDMLLYVVPLMATFVAVVSPYFTIGFLSGGTRSATISKLSEILWHQPKRLSQLSVVCTLLSPFLLLSHIINSKLFLYGAYGVVLSQVNLLVDWFGGKRAWIVLCILHVVNLISLLGGGFSVLLQIYSVSSDGIILTAGQGPTTAAYDCMSPGNFSRNIPWCSNAWILIQVAVAFAYVVLHVCVLLLLASRLLTRQSHGDAREEVVTSGGEGLVVAAALSNEGGEGLVAAAAAV